MGGPGSRIPLVVSLQNAFIARAWARLLQAVRWTWPMLASMVERLSSLRESSTMGHVNGELYLFWIRNKWRWN